MTKAVKKKHPLSALWGIPIMLVIDFVVLWLAAAVDDASAMNQAASVEEAVPVFTILASGAVIIISVAVLAAILVVTTIRLVRSHRGPQEGL